MNHLYIPPGFTSPISWFYSLWPFIFCCYLFQMKNTSECAFKALLVSSSCWLAPRRKKNYEWLGKGKGEGRILEMMRRRRGRMKREDKDSEITRGKRKGLRMKKGSWGGEKDDELRVRRRKGYKMGRKKEDEDKGIKKNEVRWKRRKIENQVVCAGRWEAKRIKKRQITKRIKKKENMRMEIEQKNITMMIMIMMIRWGEGEAESKQRARQAG